ncbi:MAG: prolyl oligopeptidase family serine peptidase [Lentisphaerales bacterium]|nr:prolyl oligopeptidase family serine peptidase [Lentisphaerales bacterium]
MRIFLLSFFIFTLVSFSQEYEKIKRRIPPKGINLLEDETKQIQQKLTLLKSKLAEISSSEKAEAEIFYKAVDFALQNGEFYKKKQDFEKALRILDEGLNRTTALANSQRTWQIKSGKTVRAFYSKIDGSPQPYILEIPEGLDLTKPLPLLVWLHGRGDKITDMHFMDKGLSGNIKYPNEKAITIHPFGRQCIGYKSAGEIDVLEAIEHVTTNYPVNENKIAMMGFSMGGAGAWHLGAHYTDKWAVVHTGAGFAETKEYTKLKKENYPAVYEQTLWGLYDVPNYSRNFLNIPLVAYSGEKDKQIQAAQVMEREFKKHGITLNHIIGSNMGHQYDPESQKKINTTVRKALRKRTAETPLKIHLQTRTLRYPKMYWLIVEGLDEHWQDSTVDAEIKTPMTMELKTNNISALTLNLPWKDKASYPPGFEIVIDGQSIKLTKQKNTIFLSKKANWQILDSHSQELRKKPYLQGPIYDVYKAPFIVVIPTDESHNQQIDKWVKFEIEHLKDRWRELFRGNLPIKKDTEVTESDIKDYNLILWGSPKSNKIIQRVINKTPIFWDASSLKVNNKNYDTSKNIPAFIYPNPENREKYIVINCDPTFRENHDRTNSLQNPKLPDWVVFDLTQAPNGDSAGNVVDADFFDEKWQFKK